MALPSITVGTMADLKAMNLLDDPRQIDVIAVESLRDAPVYLAKTSSLHSPTTTPTARPSSTFAQRATASATSASAPLTYLTRLPRISNALLRSAGNALDPNNAYQLSQERISYLAELAEVCMGTMITIGERDYSENGQEVEAFQEAAPVPSDGAMIAIAEVAHLPADQDQEPAPLPGAQGQEAERFREATPADGDDKHGQEVVPPLGTQDQAEEPLPGGPAP